jgi:transposase
MVCVLPPPKVRQKDGRPRMDDRHAVTGILLVLRTGGPWNALPCPLEAASTEHDRFQEWRVGQMFERLWQQGLLLDDELNGIE